MRTTKLIILSLIATLASFGQCVLVFNPLTNQFNCGGGATGGSVGGASNLTTVGAIPYVSASGVLNQTANLSFDVANNRLVLGSATVQRFSTDLSLSRASAGVLQVGDGGSNANGQVSARAVNAVSSLAAFNSTGGIYMSGNAGSSWGTIQSYSDGSGTAKATAINPIGGNVLIGTTTDFNFKLDVAASGNAGTARFYGGSGVAASTKVVVQAGGGQSGNLTEWQDSSGAVLASVDSNAGFSIPTAIYASTWWRLTPGSSGNTGFEFGATNRLTWSNTTANYSGTKDIGITRNAAGVLEINNGTAGTYRDLILRRSQHNGVTVADLPAAAAGNAGSIQYVTDANATTIGSTVASGGTNKVMVWSDGAAWKIFAN